MTGRGSDEVCYDQYPVEGFLVMNGMPVCRNEPSSRCAGMNHRHPRALRYYDFLVLFSHILAAAVPRSVGQNRRELLGFMTELPELHLDHEL